MDPSTTESIRSYISSVVSNISGKPNAAAELQKLEIEARMGFYGPIRDKNTKRIIGTEFRSNVKYPYVKRLIESLNTVVSDRVDLRINDIKYKHEVMKGVRQRIVNNGTPLWEKKTRAAGNLDIRQYLVRFSFNREAAIKPLDDASIPGEKFSRRMTRKEYKFANFPIIVHISNVLASEVTDDNDELSGYEVEVEMTKPCSLDKVDNYILGVVYVMKLMNGTENLYTVDLKNEIIYMINVNVITSDTDIRDKDGNPLKPSKYYIDRRILTEARAVNIDDFKMGALIDPVWNIGGKKVVGKMTATHKTHGNRKIFAVSRKKGVWIIYPPYEYNLLIPPEKLPRSIGDEDHSITIMDCELIPESRRRYEYGAPKVKYWLQVLDILFSYGNNVQHNDFITRINLARNTRDNLEKKGYIPKNLVVSIKEYYRGWDSVDQFFDVMSGMLAVRNNLPYDADGLMFIPVNHKYMIYNWDIKSKDRILSNIPDVIKWKPAEDTTIDFRLLHSPQGLRLECEGRKRDENGNPVMVIFTGKSDRPFNYDTMLMKSHPLTDNITEKIIVEYAWKFKKEPMDQKLNIGGKDILVNLPRGNYLYPIILRPEKSGPNRIDVAKRTWDAIMYPIIGEDICGTGTGLMTRYHNEIKSNIFMQSSMNLFGRKVILDIATGYGGDVGKMKKAGYDFIICVEPDEDIDLTKIALPPEEREDKLSELESRLINSGYDESTYRIINAKGQDTDKIFSVVDEVTGGEGVDTISIMLGLTFFWDNIESINSLANTINKCLKPGGKLIWMTLDGEAVRQIFRPEFGGLKYKELEFGRVKIEPEFIDVKDDNGEVIDEDLSGKIVTTFPGIVGKQVEYLVIVSDLEQLLNDFTFNTREFANKNSFMPEELRVLSKLYSYGIWTRKISQDKIPIIQKQTPGMQGGLRGLGGLSGLGGLGGLSSLSIGRPSPLDEGIGPQPLPKFKKVKGITVPFYDNIVKLTAIGDGSCLIHSFLLCVSEDYRNKGRSEQKIMAAKLRRDMADWFISHDPHTENGIRWETTARGSYAEIYSFQLIALCGNDNLVKYRNYINTTLSGIIGRPPALDEGGNLGYNIDYSPSSLFSLLNSTEMLGTEGIKILSEIFGIDIYVIQVVGNHIESVMNSSFNQRKQPSICILSSMNHFDAVGIWDTTTGLVSTVFKPGNEGDQHPFLTALRELAGLDPYNNLPPSSRDIGPFDLENMYFEFFKNIARDHGGRIPDLLYRAMEQCKMSKNDGFIFPQPVNDWLWRLDSAISNVGIVNTPLKYYVNETIKSLNLIEGNTSVNDQQKIELKNLILQKNCYYMAIMSVDKGTRDIHNINQKSVYIINGILGHMSPEYINHPFDSEMVAAGIQTLLRVTDGKPTGNILYAYEVLQKWLVEEKNGNLGKVAEIINTKFNEILKLILSSL